MKHILSNKRILVGVTGSIAAYKSPLLIRELVKAGADVNVVMTRPAKEFVSQMILSNLSRNPVIIDMFEENQQTKGAWHIQLVHECDLMIIAPAAASTLAKIAHGICDTALATLAIALPSRVPLLIAPAMDSSMWLNAATQRNIAQLKDDGAIIIPPDEGELSSGLWGPGRLPDISVLIEFITLHLEKVGSNPTYFRHRSVKESSDQSSAKINREYAEAQPQISANQISPEQIKNAVETPYQTLEDIVEKDKWETELEFEKLKKEFLGESFGEKFLQGKKILITAGPTYEKIDDVRFIANYSSGKMGYAIAKKAIDAGAEVILISGPVSLTAPGKANLIHVESADEMYDASIDEFEHCDIAILAAAVADYTPINPVKGKIKKIDTGDRLVLELQATNDILATLSSIRKEHQKVIGFALESINEIENGWKKLKSKNCDMIVVNSSQQPQSGFRGDDNTITILKPDGSEQSFPPMTKEICAMIILKQASELMSTD